MILLSWLLLAGYMPDQAVTEAKLPKWSDYMNTKGLTLVEVVVATLLLAVVLIPTFTLIHSSLGSVYAAGERSQLVAAGKSIMEEILSSSDFSIKQHKALTYSKNSRFKYDLSISYYQGNHNLRSIEVRIYVHDEPGRYIYFNTIRSVR